MDIEKAKKVINKRTERLLEEFKIEKEVEPEDEPKIAYLMQEIRANKTVLNELDKKDKIINLLLTEITAVNSGRYEYMDNDEVLEIFTKKVEGK